MLDIVLNVARTLTCDSSQNRNFGTKNCPAKNLIRDITAYIYNRNTNMSSVVNSHTMKYYPLPVRWKWADFPCFYKRSFNKFILKNMTLKCTCCNSRAEGITNIQFVVWETEVVNIYVQLFWEKCTVCNSWKIPLFHPLDIHHEVNRVICEWNTFRTSGHAQRTQQFFPLKYGISYQNFQSNSSHL